MVRLVRKPIPECQHGIAEKLVAAALVAINGFVHHGEVVVRDANDL